MLLRLRTAAPLLATALGLLAGAGPLAAWSPETRRGLAADAARIAPPDLAGQLDRFAREIAEAAGEPIAPESAADLGSALRREVDGAVAALRAFRPFSDLARRLGRVAALAAELNDPLAASSADPEEGRYAADYAAYVDSARPRFAVVLYDDVDAVDGPADVDVLIARTRSRSAELYPRVGSEYRRVGFRSGVRAFDDRSSAFGISALAYSHAVSDAARLLRYVWLAGGGADPRAVLDRPRDRVLLLRGGAP